MAHFMCGNVGLKIVFQVTILLCSHTICADNLCGCGCTICAEQIPNKKD